MSSDEYLEFEGMTCPLCGFALHNNFHGQYNHLMKHVRRGEAVRTPNPHAGFSPYKFKRVKASTS